MSKRKLLTITIYEQAGRADIDIERYQQDDGSLYQGKLTDSEAVINGYIHGRWLVADSLNQDIQPYLAEFAKGMQYSIANPEPSEHDKLRALYNQYRQELQEKRNA